MNIRITQKVNKVTLTQKKLVVKQEQRAIDNIRIDRVILREKEVLNTENFYNKQEIDNKLGISYTAGESINGHKVVYIKDNMVYLASNNNNECFNKVIGITEESVTAYNQVLIRRFGNIILTGWGLTPNAKYYLGLNGNITNTVVNSGINQLIGIAQDTNTLEVNIQLPIKRV